MNQLKETWEEWRIDAASEISDILVFLIRGHFDRFDDFACRMWNTYNGLAGKHGAEDGFRATYWELVRATGHHAVALEICLKVISGLTGSPEASISKDILMQSWRRLETMTPDELKATCENMTRFLHLAQATLEQERQHSGEDC